MKNMNMFNYELKEICTLIEKVKLNKIGDKKLREGLVSLYNELSEPLEDFNKELLSIQLNNFKSQEDIDKYRDVLERKIDPDDKMKEIIKSYNKDIIEFLNTKIEKEITKIDKNKFIDEMAKQDIDITISQLSLFEPIFKSNINKGE